MENNGNNGNRDAIYLAGGVALMVFGAGLVLSHPAVRQTVSAALTSVLPDLKGKVGIDLTAMGPDIQRYLRLKDM